MAKPVAFVYCFIICDSYSTKTKNKKKLSVCALDLVLISVFPFRGMVVESRTLGTLGKHHTPELDPSALFLLYFEYNLIKLLI